MQIVLISGSHRQESQSLRVTQYLAARLYSFGATAAIVTLAGNPLPLWDESFADENSPLRKQWETYAARLKEADGFVVISPEWHGMVPAGLKNFLLYCSANEVGHKPALITTVSAAGGGAYPVQELRTSGYKNSQICYIPQHLIIRNVGKMFEGDRPSGPDDEFIRGRADFALKLLIEYARALTSVRESGAAFDAKYASGM